MEDYPCMPLSSLKLHNVISLLLLSLFLQWKRKSLIVKTEQQIRSPNAFASRDRTVRSSYTSCDKVAKPCYTSSAWRVCPPQRPELPSLLSRTETIIS